MGIDVSGVFQARDGDCWVSLKTYDQGLRGLLRYWLGWGGGGWHYHDFGVKPLVTCPRGLPDDFEQSANTYVIRNLKTIDAIGTRNQTWLNVEEILDALPIFGHRACAVPLSIAHALTAQNASLEQWISVAGICKGIFCWDTDKDIGPRLIKVTPNWATSAESGDSVNVDCLFDFFEDEIREFTEEIAELRQTHDIIRLVYGFE